MRKMMKRIFAVILSATLLLGSFPVSTQATETKDSKGYVELNDGYLSVKVSEKNGGFFAEGIIPLIVIIGKFRILHCKSRGNIS